MDLSPETLRTLGVHRGWHIDPQEEQDMPRLIELVESANGIGAFADTGATYVTLRVQTCTDEIVPVITFNLTPALAIEVTGLDIADIVRAELTGPEQAADIVNTLRDGVKQTIPALRAYKEDP